MIVSRSLFRTFQWSQLHVSKNRLVFISKLAYFFQISKIFCSSQVQKGVIYDKKTYPNSGARTVFNGVSAETMFTSQTALLPELAAGEILVKVLQLLF